MEQAHQRQRQHHVLQPHGGDYAGAGAHQHGCEEIDQKRIREAHAGISGVFRRQVVSLGEAVDDLKVQRQVAQVIGDAGKDAGRAAQRRRG